MSFSDAITESQRQAAAKGAQELRVELRKNGTPERRDLSALRHLRELYAELSGATFDRILRQFKEGR